MVGILIQSFIRVALTEYGSNSPIRITFVSIYILLLIRHNIFSLSKCTLTFIIVMDTLVSCRVFTLCGIAVERHVIDRIELLIAEHPTLSVSLLNYYVLFDI